MDSIVSIMMTQDNTFEELFSAIEDLVVKAETDDTYINHFVIEPILKWTERAKTIVYKGIKYQPEEPSDEILTESQLIGYEADYGHPEPVAELIITFVALCNKTMYNYPEICFQGEDHMIAEWTRRKAFRELAKREGRI